MILMKKALILIIFLLIPLVFAHPHPLYSISANDTHIKIHALHSQIIDEEYVKNNLVLDECEIFNVEQDESYLKRIEAYAVMEHDCEELIIKKNTLFQDYWKNIPVSASIEGLKDNQKNNEFFKLTGNIFIDILFIFLLGLVSNLMGDFLRFVIPVSIADKANKDKNFLYKSMILHLISTYIFAFFSLNYLSSHIASHLWLLFIIVGFLIMLENYLTKKNISPYLITLIPCPATIFIVTVFLKDNLLLSIIAPILIIGPEFILMFLIKKYIKIKKDYSKILPFIFIIIGIIIFALYQPMVSSQDNNSCKFDDKTINDYFAKLELQLRTSQTCDEIISYINKHDCTSDGSVEIGQERFFFNALWNNGRKISYSYEKNQLTHLDCK
jgi:hypothetical protein